MQRILAFEMLKCAEAPPVSVNKAKFPKEL